MKQISMGIIEQSNILFTVEDSKYDKLFNNNSHNIEKYIDSRLIDKPMKSMFTHNNMDVYTNSDQDILLGVKGNIIYLIQIISHYDHLEDIIPLLVFHNDSVIINTDYEATETILLSDMFELSTITEISFSCLSRFLLNGDFNPDIAAKALATNRLKYVDSTSSKTRELSKKEIDDFHENKSITRTGYTLQFSNNLDRHQWYIPGYLLLHWKKNHSILLGMDEDLYFGCLITNDPETVKDALDILTPKEAKGTKYARQGEWFMVPVIQKEEPKYYSSHTINTENIILPRPNSNSNHHMLSGDIIIDTKTGIIYANSFILTHNDHKNIVCYDGKWYKFIVNNTKLNYSEECVD